MCQFAWASNNNKNTNSSDNYRSILSEWQSKWDDEQNDDDDQDNDENNNCNNLALVCIREEKGRVKAMDMCNVCMCAMHACHPVHCTGSSGVLQRLGNSIETTPNFTHT